MSTPRRAPLAAWLAASALLVSVVPAVLLAGVAMRQISAREATRDAELRFRLAQAVAGEISRYLDAQVIHLTEVRVAAEGRLGLDPEGLQAELALHVASNPAVQSIVVVEPDGRVAWTSPDDPELRGTDLSGQAWLSEARLRGTPTWSVATISPRTGRPSVTLVVPGRKRSYVAFLDLADLGEITSSAGKAWNGTLTVLDGYGNVIAGGGPRSVDEHVNLRGLPVVSRGLEGTDAEGVVDLDGERQLASVVAVRHTGWLVMVAEPEEEALVKLGRSRLLLLLVLAGGVGLALLSAAFLTRRIVQPVRALAARSSALATGEPPPPTSPGTFFRFQELDELTRSFDRMAGAVRSREQDLRLVLDTALDGYFVLDATGALVDVNPATCDIVGYSRDELVGRPVTLLAADGAAAEMEERFRSLREQGSARFDTSLRRKDGGLVRVSFSLRVNPDARRLTVCFLRDVTERRRVQDALRASEAQYRSLIDNLRAGVVVREPGGRLVLANRTAGEIVGLSPGELDGSVARDPAWRPVREDGSPLPPEELPWSRVVASSAPVVNQLVGIDRPAARDRTWVLVNAYPVFRAPGELLHVVETFIDVTADRKAESDRKTVQSQIALASRLAAMGTLVAGAAHEINNPLAASLSGMSHAIERSRELQRALDGDAALDREAERRRIAEVVEALVDAEAGGRRVAQIVRDLTAFGRPDAARTRIRLSDVVNDAMRWLPASLAGTATVRVEDRGAPDVSASAGQLGQVVVNLVNNAAKAYPEGKRGLVVVRIGPGEPGWARLEVVDQGVGIDPAIQERIFEPFFTTRPVGAGRGTGLGLAICHTIVTGHGGTITVSSTPGQGSTFRVDLPALAAGASPESRRVEACA